MKCPTCDATVEENVAYCPNCGTRLAPPSSAGARTVLLPDPSTDESASGPSEGQTIALRDVPVPPRGTQPLDAQVSPSSAPTTFGLPPASQSPYTPPVSPPPYTPPVSPSPPYTPPYTPPTNTPQPYTPSQSYAPYPPSIGQISASVPSSTAAIISLVFGILSWSFLPVISPFVAVIAGHMARREIRGAQGRVGGNGLATVGLILGYLNLVLLFLFCVLFAIGIATSNS